MKKKNKTKKKILKETIIIQILMKMLKIFSEKYQKLKNVSYVQHIMYLYVRLKVSKIEWTAIMVNEDLILVKSAQLPSEPHQLRQNKCRHNQSCA